jgi:hypothetical protein
LLRQLGEDRRRAGAGGAVQRGEARALADAEQEGEAAGGDRVRNREVEKQYVELAINRDYSQGDTATGPEDIYTFLESLGGKLVPHGSQGPPVYSGGEALDSGHFFAHLSGNEQCVRDWQSSDGPELYPDAVCLAALSHSLCK